MREINERNYFLLISHYLTRDQRQKSLVANLWRKLVKKIVSHHLVRDQQKKIVTNLKLISYVLREVNHFIVISS